MLTFSFSSNQNWRLKIKIIGIHRKSLNNIGLTSNLFLSENYWIFIHLNRHYSEPIKLELVLDEIDEPWIKFFWKL